MPTSNRFAHRRIEEHSIHKRTERRLFAPPASLGARSARDSLGPGEDAAKVLDHLFNLLLYFAIGE